MKFTKDFKYVKPGHATWKFQIGKQIVYRVKNADGLKFYWKIRDRETYTIYVRTKVGWQHVVDRSPKTVCNCGRAYDDTPNGETFKFQEYPSDFTIEAIVQVMRSPILCQMCYYRKELQDGRWAPKHVRIQLGLER